MRPSRKSNVASFTLVALVVLTACAQALAATATPTGAATATRPTMVTPAGTPPATITPAALATPAAAGTPGAFPPEAAEMIDQARAAVSRQLGIEVDRVTVTSVQTVEWGDFSLGCPEEGMSYAQMATLGYLIELTAGGQIYEYHADLKGTVITCPNPQPPARVES